MGISNFIPAWSVLHQIAGKDRLGLGKAAQSSHQANLTPRTAEADEVVKSICLVLRGRLRPEGLR